MRKNDALRRVEIGTISYMLHLFTVSSMTTIEGHKPRSLNLLALYTSPSLLAWLGDNDGSCTYAKNVWVGKILCCTSLQVHLFSIC